MGSEQKLWEDMTPTEKFAATRELAEQVQALRSDKTLRQKTNEAQPIQLRPSVCSRLGKAFLLSAASPPNHTAARFKLSHHPAWNFSPATEREAVFYRQHTLVGTTEDINDYKKQSLHAKFAYVAEVIGDAGVYGHRS
jgi:hypothetical protein